jgi:hypothetical protein
MIVFEVLGTDTGQTLVHRSKADAGWHESPEALFDECRRS